MRLLAVPILMLLVAGCAPTLGSRAVVKGTGAEEFLKLRSGPSLQYTVVLGLPEGTALTRHACVTELGQLWCKVSLADAPGVSGYVSADYLAAP